MAWVPGWGRWGFGRGGRWGWAGPWPGRGPFSYLPPWQRPGWIFGRRTCWWLYGWPWYMHQYPYWFTPYYWTPPYYPYYPYYMYFRPYPWW